MNNYQKELIQIAAVAIAALQTDLFGDTNPNRVVSGFPVMEDIFTELRKERRRQEDKFGVQARSKEKWMVILMEEVGEAAKDILENG